MHALQLKQDYIVAAGLALLLAAGCWLVSISTGTEGGEDSFMHYLFARYVPMHPENLLDHWAKPLHTLLLAPFAQFGFAGAKIYNCIAGIITAWFTYKTAQRLRLKTAMASVVLLLFAPMYFLCINSALTEITFSMVLAVGLYFLVAQQYWAAAIVLSFLPFARTEGFILLPFFGLYFLVNKKWLPLLLLGAGLIIYSLVGYFYHHHDILWVFTKNPYAGKNGVYNSGPLTHFADGYRDIWGGPQTILLTLGMLSFLLGRRAIPHTENKTFYYWLLIVGCAVAYFAAHSIVWYLGIQGSAGLIRVMAGVMPLFALIVCRGLEVIYKPFVINKNLRLAIVCTVLFFVIQYPLTRYRLPAKLGPEENTLYEAGNWYKKSPFYTPGNKVFYFAPTVALAFGIDPFDFDQRGFLDDVKKTGSVKQHQIVVYDTHFGPNECQIPLATMQTDTSYELLKSIIPTDSFTTLGGYNYEVHIFRKK